MTACAKFTSTDHSREIAMHDTCEVEGCSGIHYCRSFCRTHYQRWLRHGDSLIRGRLGPNKVASPLTAARKAAAMDLFNQGVSFRVIGEKLGVSKQRAFQLIGVTRRAWKRARVEAQDAEKEV